MAQITRSARANIDANSSIKAPQLTRTCGEDVDACAPVYIGADQKWYMSNGAADNAAAQVHGFSSHSAKMGEELTAYGPGLIMKYGSGLTPGKVYLAAAKGKLDTAATVGDSEGIAHIFDDQHIRVLRFK